MSTLAQQNANQANALLSTGPRTPEGKAHSARNARVHGLCGKDLLIGPEEQPEFDRMIAGYYTELDPAGDVEQTLFDEVVGAAWQLRRVRRMETALYAGPASYTELLDDDTLQKKIERLHRHHTRIERTFHRCLKELKAAIAARRREEEMAEIKRQFAPMRISERTQSTAFPDDTHPLPDPDPAGNPATPAPVPLVTGPYGSAEGLQ